MSELLHMQCVSKTFGGIHALQNVDFHLQERQVHALVGKNGAGKSTLMKILMGVFPPDGGQIFLHGKPAAIPSPQAAHALGISIVYQELSLIPTLTVAENVFLGRLPRRGGRVRGRRGPLGDRASRPARVGGGRRGTRDRARHGVRPRPLFGIPVNGIDPREGPRACR